MPGTATYHPETGWAGHPVISAANPGHVAVAACAELPEAENLTAAARAVHIVVPAERAVIIADAAAAPAEARPARLARPAMARPAALRPSSTARNGSGATTLVTDNTTNNSNTTAATVPASTDADLSGVRATTLTKRLTGKYREKLGCITLMPDFVLRTDPRQNYAFVMPRMNDEEAGGGIIVNEATFPDTLRAQDCHLSEGGERLRDTPNAGGSSVWSEVMSFEVLRELFGATLERTETEIGYQWFLGGGNSKITDYSTRMFDQTIGVSVTRALRYGAVFELEDAVHLLTKKLDGVNQSTDGVIDPHKWTRQFLHIWAESPYIADVLTAAYKKIDNDLRANTVVMVTVSRGGGEWLYRTPRVYNTTAPRASL